MEQEIIDQITETVTKNVLETVMARLDEEKNGEQEKASKDMEAAKETIKSVIRK